MLLQMEQHAICGHLHDAVSRSIPSLTISWSKTIRTRPVPSSVPFVNSTSMPLRASPHTHMYIWEWDLTLCQPLAAAVLLVASVLLVVLLVCLHYTTLFIYLQRLLSSKEGRRTQMVLIPNIKVPEIRTVCENIYFLLF